MKLALNGDKISSCPPNCSHLSRHGHYVIPGDPVPLARTRYGKGRVWDSQKQIKLGIGIQLSQQHGKNPLFSHALGLYITFYFPFAQSMSGVKKKANAGKPHYYKPDLSNLIKFMEDVGTGVLYHDDAAIASITAHKIYDEEPRTEFVVTEL